MVALQRPLTLSLKISVIYQIFWVTEIEGIVAAGTRLDIDYYITQTLDEDVVDEIYDWFKEEATSDSLEEALAALEGDYEQREIRLVRIKFLCEVAN